MLSIRCSHYYHNVIVDAYIILPTIASKVIGGTDIAGIVVCATIVVTIIMVRITRADGSYVASIILSITSCTWFILLDTNKIIIVVVAAFLSVRTDSMAKVVVIDRVAYNMVLIIVG